MGLNRLNRLITAADGSFEAGPDDMGYALKAVIPAMRPAGGTSDDSGKAIGNGTHQSQTIQRIREARATVTVCLTI